MTEDESEEPTRTVNAGKDHIAQRNGVRWGRALLYGAGLMAMGLSISFILDLVLPEWLMRWLYW